ncbi:MAG: non-ribosomal peptide synthetase, partial [Pseudorhodobacter sp.]
MDVIGTRADEGAEGFVLTPVQAGMIYEILAGRNASVNLEQVVLHLPDEAPDEAAMRAAWQGAIARHPALRLVFGQDGAGAIRQVVADPFAAPLEVQDCSDIADPRAMLEKWLIRDRKRGVELTRAGSWRLHWLRFAPRHSVLVWTFSHVMLDGRSFARILEEVFADYDGSRPAKGGSSALPRLPEFRAHCEALARAETGPAKAYFRDYLSGYDRRTALGFADARGRAAGRNRTLERRLDADRTRALQQRAEAAGASFATMVQAAWGLVLARISGQSEAVFGVTRSGRFLTEAAGQAVGCLISTQPLRLRIAPDLGLDDLLGQIRAALLQQRPFEHLGLPDIGAVTDLPPGQPLFDTLVMAERQSLDQRLRDLGGAWAGRRVELHETGALPMTLAAYGDTELLLRLEHAPKHIGPAEARRYLDYLHRLLIAMAGAPAGTRLCALSMLPEKEERALAALALPEVPLPADRPACIASGFEAVAARQPEAIALEAIGSGERYSYGALEARANQLAHDLVARGVGPGDRIGICLPRSGLFMALILATAKIGAAFVPMDPGYPEEALAHMADDSAVKLIYARAGEGWLAGRAVVLADAALACEAPVSAPDRAGLSPDRAAYVIYTSGTTGKPKGVVISQAGFAAHAAAAIAEFGLTPRDRALQFGALSFDVALEEIVPTLLAGAALILRDEAMLASPQAFVEAVAAAGITVLNLPTGFWQVLLAGMGQGRAELPPGIRLMVVGGERMPPDALARWQALPAMPRLINGYGPTEATITSCCFSPAGAVSGAEVPVGRAMGHALCYLLAPDRSLAPRGALAELWLGGAAVAQGYLNRAALTAERFLADPFRPSGRIYRSGDLARWDGQGQIVVQGRSDRQVKLRGFRIEPGEIEAFLEGLPGVAQAHVGLVQPEGPAARLLGWLRPSDAAAPPDLAVLEGLIAEELPAQKRPELVLVTDWPQTPGGKVDVKALPLPQRAPAEAGEVLLPADPQAERIAGIFAAVLGGEVPGPDMSFFDLGGHSLLLLTLIGHIEAAFSKRLSVAQVHANPTPRGLAGLLDGPVTIAAGADLFDCLLPIQPLGTGVTIYGVHVLGINGSFFRPLAQVMGMEQPIFGLSTMLLREDTPTTIADIADLYLRVIVAHRPDGPIGLVAVSQGSFVALELAQRLRAAGREVRLFAVMDAEGPGGRDRIRGLAWVGAHLKLLRGGGWPYAGRLLRAKLNNTRHRLEKLRLTLIDRFSSQAAVVDSVSRFVAANEIAVNNYQPRPYPGRITVIRARDDVFDSDRAI